MGNHLYIASTDYINWADKQQLQNTTLTVGQGVTEDFTIMLQNYRQPDALRGIVGGALPLLPVGHATIMYINIPDESDKSVYEVRFSGVVQSVTGSDASYQGAQMLTCATPTKPLKVVLHSIVFQNPPNGELTDTARIREFGRKVGGPRGQLPGWDFDKYVSPDVLGNISYGSFVYPPRGDGTDVDRYQEYQESTAEQIIRDIATDPGQPTDIGYPVQARNWWVEAEFVDPLDVTQGVIWYLHYQNVPVPGVTLPDLMDAPPPPVGGVPVDPLTYTLYEQGATYNIDFTKMVRHINIGGPAQSTSGMSWAPQPIYWTFAHRHNTRQKSGIIAKDILGEAGVWDSGDTGLFPSWDDWEVTCQTQEIYLEHDTFQRPDMKGGLGASAMSGAWQNPATSNLMSIKNCMAVPEYQPNEPGSHMHFAILETYASTCILRAHLGPGGNQAGALLLFRWQDVLNYWCIRVEVDGYSLVHISGGGPLEVHSFAMDRPDNNQEIKVSMVCSDIQNQIQVFINDVLKLQWNAAPGHERDPATLWDKTKAGLGADCQGYSTGKDTKWWDFQCTHFWGDKAFGMGDNPEVTSWIHLSFGFIFDSNGDLRLTKSANPLDDSEWEQVGLPPHSLRLDEGSYTYNDRFKVLTAKYLDHDDHTLKRLVQWLKQPEGQGEWILLADFRPVTVPLLDPAHPWRPQFAAKETGAALSNTMYGRTLSNLFVAETPPWSPVFGGPDHYPASGLLQSDQLDNYQKRQAVADGVFRALAEPIITFNCVVLSLVDGTSPFKRGQFARITNRRAGWGGGPDLAPPMQMMCSSVQRVETGKLSQPKYALQFGPYQYANDDPGRTHLLRQNTKQKVIPTLTELPSFDGSSLYWDENAAFGLMNYGRRIEIQIIPYDAADWTSQTWPTQSFDMPVTAAYIPPSALPASGKFYVRYRTMGDLGTSDWSQGVPFISAPGVPPDRLTTLMWTLGNNVDPIGVEDYSEVQIQQECKIVGWSASTTGIDADMQFALFTCTNEKHRTDGMTAYTAIPFGDEAPHINAGDTPPGFLDGFNMAGWGGQDLRTGDWIRMSVTGAVTTAVTGTFVLMFEALGLVNKTQGGASGVGGGAPGGGGDGGPSHIGDGQVTEPDGHHVTESDNVPITGG